MWFAKYFLLFVYCLIEVSSDSIPELTAGFPEKAVKSADPLYVEKLEGKLPGFTYTFYNTTITGLKDCDVSSVQIDSKLTNLHYELTCPSIKMEGQYEMSGQLITIPVEGNGHFTITTGIYYVTVDSKLQSTVIDGKTYLIMKGSKLKSEARSPVKYVFENLYNGHEDKGSAFLKSSHDNWKIVQEQADGPVWNTIIDTIAKNSNSYFKTVAL